MFSPDSPSSDKGAWLFRNRHTALWPGPSRAVPSAAVWRCRFVRGQNTHSGLHTTRALPDTKNEHRRATGSPRRARRGADRRSPVLRISALDGFADRAGWTIRSAGLKRCEAAPCKASQMICRRSGLMGRVGRCVAYKGALGA